MTQKLQNGWGDFNVLVCKQMASLSFLFLSKGSNSRNDPTRKSSSSAFSTMDFNSISSTSSPIPTIMIWQRKDHEVFSFNRRKVKNYGYCICPLNIPKSGQKKKDFNTRYRKNGKWAINKIESLYNIWSQQFSCITISLLGSMAWKHY